MKKIIINMEDRLYAERLDAAFKELYFEKLSSTVEKGRYYQGENYLENDAIITDNIEILHNSKIPAIYFTKELNSSGLFKYQNIDNIYREIISTIEKSSILKRQMDKVKVINYFTYFECPYKNILLDSLAKKLKKNYKVLLINLKQSFDKSDYNLENLIISIKLNNKLEDNIDLLADKIDENYYQINGFKNPIELENLDKKSIKNLYRSLKAIKFDFVLLDLDFRLESKYVDFFQLADKNYIQSSSENLLHLREALIYLDKADESGILDKTEINYHGELVEENSNVKSSYIKKTNSKEAIEKIYKGLF